MSRQQSARDDANHHAPDVFLGDVIPTAMSSTHTTIMADELERARCEAQGRERILEELATLPAATQVALMQIACTTTTPIDAVERFVAILLPDADSDRILAVAGAFRTDDNLREQLSFAWKVLRRMGAAPVDVP